MSLSQSVTWALSSIRKDSVRHLERMFLFFPINLDFSITMVHSFSIHLVPLISLPPTPKAECPLDSWNKYLVGTPLCKIFAKWWDRYNHESSTGTTLRNLSLMLIYITYTTALPQSGISTNTLRVTSSQEWDRGVWGNRRDEEWRWALVWTCWVGGVERSPEENGLWVIRKYVTRVWKECSRRHWWHEAKRLGSVVRRIQKEELLKNKRDDSEVPCFLIR
jgi:hypothetical protein